MMKFKIVEHKGQGGFGKVEKILSDDGKYYALKTYNLASSIKANAEFIEHAKKRFRKEAKVQQQIEHPHVVPVLETELAKDPPSFIMPLAAASMADDMEDGTLDRNNFMDCFLQIMEGLEEVHSYGIYHRDLKPGNVLRFSNRKGDIYAVGDFGLLSLSETGLTTLTPTGMKKGSDMYTAPEITKDLHHASVQSDIYSLGCMLHDFIGMNSRIPCHEIVETSEYGDVLAGATRFDPTRRFKNVASFRDALLSVKKASVHPKTKVAEDVITSLRKDIIDFSEADINQISDFLASHVNQNEKDLVLDEITFKHVERIKENAKSGTHIAKCYCSYARNKGFEFSFTDVVCGRVLEFMEDANIDVTAEGIFALLYLGTRHNRFYVEKKAVQYFTGDIEDRLLKRMCMEIRIDGGKFCDAINHLFYSIRYSIGNLNTEIQKTIKEVCG